MAKKPVLTAAEAAKMIPDGATVMCGGFLACGQARAIVKELVKLGTKDLTLIANDMGRAVGPKGEEFFGIAELIHNHQVKRIIATHVGMTPEVGQQNTEGTLEVNLLPQGTLAECIRAGGAGLGGVLTPVGVDTLIEESPFCMGKAPISAMSSVTAGTRAPCATSMWLWPPPLTPSSPNANTSSLWAISSPRTFIPMVCALTTSWKETESNGKV